MAQDEKLSLRSQRLAIPRAVVKDLSVSLYALLVGSFPRGGERVDELTVGQKQALLCLGVLMDSYAVIPDGMSDSVRTLVKQAQEQERQNQGYAAFSTRCPYCGHENAISVIQVTLTYLGGMMDVDVPLQSDGFDVYDYCSPDAKDLSTEGERVRCNECHTEFDLGELLL